MGRKYEDSRATELARELYRKTAATIGDRNENGLVRFTGAMSGFRGEPTGGAFSIRTAVSHMSRIRGDEMEQVQPICEVSLDEHLRLRAAIAEPQQFSHDFRMEADLDEGDVETVAAAIVDGYFRFLADEFPQEFN